MSDKNSMPATDSARDLRNLVHDDATAEFENDPEFVESNPTQTASSENLATMRDTDDEEESDDELEDEDDEEYEDDEDEDLDDEEGEDEDLDDEEGEEDEEEYEDDDEDEEDEDEEEMSASQFALPRAA